MSASDISLNDIFGLRTVLKNIEIRLSARIERGYKKLLALVTGDGDIVLYYTNGEYPATIKRVAWFTDSKKSVEAICFDPTATWLVAVALDSTVFIIPALALVDKKQRIDCKWAINDLTQFPRHQLTPIAKPTSVIWWQTVDCNQNAVISYDSGEVALISLTDGRCLTNTSIPESIVDMILCQDQTLDIVCLLINGVSGRQWRLLLEQHTTGYIWPPDAISDDSAKSRLSNLKQMGVDKLVSLKQRIAEARGQRRDSQTSDSTSESSNPEPPQSAHPELLPHLPEMSFSPQYAHGRYLFAAFYKPGCSITIHSCDPDTSPLHVYKLPDDSRTAILSDYLLFVINDEMTRLSIISTQYSECHLEDEGEFSSLDPIAVFDVKNKDEKILTIYKLTNSAIYQEKKSSDDSMSDIDIETKNYSLPKDAEDLDIHRPKTDTCVLVTNQAVYEVIINICPITKFIKAVTEQNNFELADRLCYVFCLNQQQLLELCGDILIANGSFHTGLILYKQAKVHLLKRVLKVALSADCKSLLKFVNLCLIAGKVDMSVATKIHIGNLAVMAHTEVVLRYSGFMRVNNIKEFMNFLCFEEYYDQVLAVNVACQAGLWSIVAVLAKSRGLQMEVTTGLCQILHSNRAPTFNNEEFTFALSEPCLTASFLTCPNYSQTILNYIKANVNSFGCDVLKRFIVQLDPSQPKVLPFVSRLFQHSRKYSSLDSTVESTDFENPDRSVAIVKELIEAFIYVLITYVSKTTDKKFDLSLLEKIAAPDVPVVDKQKIKKLPDLKQISCGFEHAAVIRNGSVYTMGVSSSGCLGTGALLSQTSPPKIVQTLTDLKVKALSVSCGRKHTLVLTDFGVYGFGSNLYGQLGLGPVVQESPYPQLITQLSHLNIVDIVAGQYHTVALTSHGQVYTWGWGIHGQLGHRTCDNEYYPKRLQFPKTIVQIAAGHAHTIIITANGKMYGFGSNVFGQLDCTNACKYKTAGPARIFLQSDMNVPIEKVASAYFHNIAVRADQQVYTWGSSPQEVRMSKYQKVDAKTVESFKSSVLLYSGGATQKPVEKVAVGYRHSVILHNGIILYTKCKGGQLNKPKMSERESILNQRFVEISCGSDFMMGLEQSGRVLAWGGPSLSQAILGRTGDDDPSKRLDGKVVVFRNTKRMIKFPTASQSGPDPSAVEIPGLPSMAITFSNTDPRQLTNRHYTPYSIIGIENEVNLEQLTCNKPLSKNAQISERVFTVPDLKFTERTLHYVLETYYNHYDTESVLTKCLEVYDFQAASKISMLDGHFSDSLGFQLAAFRTYMDKYILDFGDTKKTKTSTDDLNEINEKLNSKTCSPARILSSSSSLDSIQQWGDEMEHQGGRESPCRISEMGDVRQNVAQYVQSVKSDNSPPIASLSKIVDSKSSENKESQVKEKEIDLLDEKTKEIVKIAAELVEFYTKKIYASENHILMQNVLMKCIDFWLVRSLPVTMLEDVLLKNMDKYFYPLSILLFCKNFNNNTGEDVQDGKLQTSAGFLKQFSTKFCLQLCSMVLENVNKS